MAGQSSVVPKLREIAARDDVSETVRTAILEALYKLDQDQLRADPMDLNVEPPEPIDLNVSDNEPAFLHNSL